MSNFKIEFTLKQHTPIIHFQSDQAGATLRATELKPKLDKFLIEHVANVICIKNANGHKSLDYKIKIISNGVRTERIEKINQKGNDVNDPLFFGNMKPKSMSVEDFEKIRKKFQIHAEEFQIEFFTLNSTLKDAIQENFESFLANTNFGTRQSKGFGSFYIKGEKFKKSLIKTNKVYSFPSKKWKEDISLFYKFLRQGINLPRDNPFYCKPAIFAYAKEKGWQWDKKTIKQHYFNDELKQQIKVHNSPDILAYDSETKYLLRDLFGLSSSQEWKSYNATIEKVGERIEVVNNHEVIAVQRFKSPITFKIVDDTVYFWVSNTLLLNESFKIKVGGRDTLTLSTPPEFNFDEFFLFVFNINLSQHIENLYHDETEYKSLNRIIDNIRISL
jgi:CRISPR/Cas system CMR-associated protein Cmr1 (group 7 of RAMP superfamily)